MYRSETPTRGERVAAIRARHAELLALPVADFKRWCERVAGLEEDSVHGLIPALIRLSCATGRVHDIDPRLIALRAAEHEAVDSLRRDELYDLLREHRLTRDQAEYWQRRRPGEVSDPPPWIAPTLVDVVDRGHG